MKELKVYHRSFLTGTAFVDDDMFELLKNYHWTIGYGKCRYVTTAIRFGEKTKVVSMHHFVLGCPIYPYVSDHKDGNTYNNIRSNLEICTERQNSQNRHLNTGTLLGVSTTGNRKNPFKSRIRVNGTVVNIGVYKTKIEAFHAYKEAVENLGEFIMPYVLEKCYKIIDCELLST